MTSPRSAGLPETAPVREPAEPSEQSEPTGQSVQPAPSGTAATPVPDARSAVLNPRFVMRVAALPLESVERLRQPDARAWADGVLDAQRQLRALAAELDAPLTALVKATEDAGQRREVLAVRRAVFNARLPQDPQVVARVAAAAGQTTGALLARWLDAVHGLRSRTADGAAQVERGLAAARAELRALAGEDRLRRGLVLGSPTLDAHLDAYIEDPSPVPDKRARKKERSLLSYLYRTACKTSPFSTFTGVAAGRFAAGAGDPVTGGPWTGHARLNVVVTARLAELIAADPARRADLPVAPSAGWEVDEDRVRFVRRSVTAGDDSAAVSFDAAHDRLFFLRRRGILERLLARFADGARLRYSEVEEWLAAETGAPPHEAARYPATLLDLGILQVTGLETDVHAGDPLRSFQTGLRALDRDWAAALADRLDPAASCVERYAAADATGRRALLRELRAELRAVQGELGAPEDASLPQTLLYEDVAEPPVTAGVERWTQLAAGSLHELAAVLPAFDVSLAQRLVLKGFFLARYGRGGRCDDVLTLVHDFHEDIFTQYLQFTALKSPLAEDGSAAPEENWLGMAEVTALDRARAAFTDRMRQAWAAHPEQDGELRLDDGMIAEVAAELAPLGRPFAPHSHFVQLADRPHDPLVVLNNSYGGLCFPFTRFTHLFDADADATPEAKADPSPDAGACDDRAGLSAELRRTLRAWQPPGAVFAEVTAGAATTNLNLHSRLTSYEIVCPGETSTAPAQARIALDDLYAEHDEAEDRLVLRSRRLGREVVPLYLGYLVPMVLPEVPRTLLLFSPTSRARPDAWRGVPAGPDRAGVTCRPRVRWRSLVLHRRSWTAAPGALPVREPGAGEAAAYLGWQQWRHEHGLPERVFATVHRETAGSGSTSDANSNSNSNGNGDGGGTGGKDAAGAAFGGSKPAYVDFDSPLSLLALEGLLAGGPARVVFEEMLPAPDMLHVRSTRGRHVAELALEIVPRPAPGPDRHGRQDPPR